MRNKKGVKKVNLLSESLNEETEDKVIQLCHDMVTLCDNKPYAELMVILSWVNAVAKIHQVHHWISNADPFYGDHLMFDRLQSETYAYNDKVAEKMLGLGDDSLITPKRLASFVNMVTDLICTSQDGIIMPDQNSLVMQSKMCVEQLLLCIQALKLSMLNSAILTDGLDNFLSQLLDDIENHMYLLKQRLKL